MLHYTAMQEAKAALRTLCNPATEVSAHYLIAEDGTVFSLVPEELRAWHAGAGSWGQITDVNSRSIGIELANPGNCPFAAAQMDALEELLSDIRPRWSIPAERVIGHSDMAPGRKIDPGKRFDWRRLALSGHAIWPNAATATGDFVAAMQRLGVTATDDQDLLLATLRMRFRPWADGPIDDRDRAIAADLARRFPVDGSAANL